MTEAELIQTAHAIYANVNSAMAIVITLITGYLVAAYLAGKDMTVSQIVIINGLYLLIVGVTIAGIVSLSLQAGEMATLAIGKTTERTIGPATHTPIIIGVVLAACTLASLKFMWDIRHPKP